MNAMGGRLTTERLPLEHLDPNFMTRLAYVAHTAGDPTRTNRALDPLVQREMEVFEILLNRFDPLSRDGKFLSILNGHLTGIAQDITRRKKEYLDDIAAADREYEVLHARYDRSTKWSITVKATFAVGRVVFLGAVGLMISKILEPYVPASVAHQTGTHAPSALMTFLTLVVGGWVGYKINEFSRASIETTRNWRKQEARLKYDRGRLQAFRQNWDELRSAWAGYTGREYQNTAFFELVIEGDFRADSDYIQMLRLQQRSMVVVVIETLRNTAAVCARAVRRQGAMK